jgi:hypothetical protein
MIIRAIGGFRLYLLVTVLWRSGLPAFGFASRAQANEYVRCNRNHFERMGRNRVFGVTSRGFWGCFRIFCLQNRPAIGLTEAMRATRLGKSDWSRAWATSTLNLSNK